jgi:sugar lactone lactonase YvrE
MEVLRSGLGLVESPRWHDGRLWFSDWTAGEIIAIDDAGVSEVIVRHESLPLCFDFLPDGRLVLVSNRELALLTQETDGSLATYADLSVLSQLGGNDIVVDGRGNAYVNSPNFEFSAGPPAGALQPGVVGLVTPDGDGHRRGRGHRVSERDGGHRRQRHVGGRRFVSPPTRRLRHPG